jgi:bifunctional DNase/RNase
MLIKVEVFGLTMDPVSNSPIVILKAVDGEEALPIWIGILEATAIASVLEEIEFSRPMTHDLLKIMIETLGAKVEKVVVCDLRENTYYALIYLKAGDTTYEIDARPSDAIALALRTEAPIFVDEKVFTKTKEAVKETQGDKTTSDEEKKWEEILENLSPEDFGKYKM